MERPIPVFGLVGWLEMGTVVVSTSGGAGDDDGFGQHDSFNR